jgi:hypothetical protein
MEVCSCTTAYACGKSKLADLSVCVLKNGPPGMVQLVPLTPKQKHDVESYQDSSKDGAELLGGSFCAAWLA